IGLVHLGWKSITLNLFKNVFDEFKNNFSSNTSDLEVYLGPSIDSDSYIQTSPSQLNNKKWTPFLKKVVNGYQVDLKGYLKSEITKLSKAIKIKDLEIDTATSLEYFSHYRSVKSGLKEERFATLVH